jgi:dihydropteroate synthase
MTPVWRLADRTLELEHPVGVGIVNVTRDSMFEGARSVTPEGAVEDGRRLLEEGFEMLDVGAVAARSGPPVPAEEEASRLIPAIEGLANATEAPLSADTFSPEVAERALRAGAVAINDIGGGEPAMLEVAASTGCGLVIMHIEGRPREDRAPRDYGDPVDHLRGWFDQRVELAASRGVSPEQIAIDPGLDFDLSVADNLEILRRLGELRELGRPLYVSLSRKDFLGAMVAGAWDRRLPASEREWATASAAAIAVAAGADLLRLHDASALQAVRIAAAIAGDPVRGHFSSSIDEKAPRVASESGDG